MPPVVTWASHAKTYDRPKRPWKDPDEVFAPEGEALALEQRRFHMYDQRPVTAPLPVDPSQPLAHGRVTKIRPNDVRPRTMLACLCLALYRAEVEQRETRPSGLRLQHHMPVCFQGACLLRGSPPLGEFRRLSQGLQAPHEGKPNEVELQLAASPRRCAPGTKQPLTLTAISPRIVPQVLETAQAHHQARKLLYECSQRINEELQGEAVRYRSPASLASEANCP